MKFYHIADVHLGAVPDRGRPYSEQRRQDIWDTFRDMIHLAVREQPDCLFVCGDLFHRQPLKRELKEVDYLFSLIPDTRVFLMAGNHDFAGEGSAYRRFSWSPNVLFFAGEVISGEPGAVPGDGTAQRDPPSDSVRSQLSEKGVPGGAV